MLLQPERRKKEPENYQIMFGFVVGVSLFLNNLLNEWGHFSLLLFTASLAMGTFAVFASTMICKKSEDLDRFVKIGACAGAGVLLILLPLCFHLFYGSDYSMTSVLVTAGISAGVSFYSYYDVVGFQDVKWYRDNDYIMAALLVYIDIFIMFWFYCLKPLMSRARSANYSEQRDDS